jgi:hypothetical protein
MDGHSKPTEAVVPLVTVNPQTPGRVKHYLGTGFFVTPTLLLTARHVLQVPVPAGDRVAAVLIDQAAWVLADDIQFSQQHDIASCRVDRPEDARAHLALEDDDTFTYNIDVMSVEYSGVTHEVLATGDTATIFPPSFRRGHVVQRYTSSFGVATGSHVLDVSYPALKGASGAPVFYSFLKTGVVGMIVGNVERHLMPAQVLRVEGPGERVEEISYFLPQAQAIRTVHLREHMALVEG